MPMIVLRRIDVLLEPTKDKVLARKEFLDNAGITNQDALLCRESGFPFFNTSKFTLKTLVSETDPTRLKINFIDYLNGYSEDIQDIIAKFKLRQQVDNLAEADRLGSLIAKFTDSNINLSVNPVVDDEGHVVLPGLDNHTMGTIFEELLRKFNEENNVTEAGEHFTPRDYVKLLADIAVRPVADKIENVPYSVYDGACGTGGILYLAKQCIQRVQPSAKINIFGQELQPETYATCKADLMISGELESVNYSLGGNVRQYFAFGSTISQDGHPGETYDFCISNPPFGTPWKEDLKIRNITDKKDFVDSRFQIETGDEFLSFIPDIGDPQMLFLANNVSRMKDTRLGTRIVEIHNGSSLFTGKAGGGESNLRRYIIENDMLEAVIAMPEKMFYNTGIGTYVWVVTNRKAPNRRGKVQLINATEFKTPLRKNLGEKNCELSDADRERIVDLLIRFEETPESKIFDNEEFGYWEMPVLRPKRDKEGQVVVKKGKVEYAKTRNESERVPLNYPGGIEAFYQNEVAPYDAEARFGEPVLGYELSFTKYFYKPVELRTLQEISEDILEVEKNTAGMLAKILEG
jgi:type I restriction enzyme M protein